MNDWAKYAGRLNEEFGGKALWHCHLLNGQQFAVTPKLLKACGSATHNGGSPAICAYREPAIDAFSFLTGLAMLIRANQTSGGPCVGCRYLIRTKIPQHFAGSFVHTISLHDFSGCNSHCIYCMGSEYDLPEKFKATFDHAVLFSNLLSDRMIRSWRTSVSWGGGEPTLLNTFEDTVEFLRQHHIFQVINTNGICFSRAIEQALKSRMAMVRISVDSGTAETFQKVKRNPNYDAVWETVRRYAMAGGEFVLKYIVCPFNSESGEAYAFVEKAHQAGVRRICISIDAHYAYPHLRDGDEFGHDQIRTASRIYTLAKGMSPYFEGMWPAGYLHQVEEMGGFKITSPSKTMSMIRRGLSLARAL